MLERRWAKDALRRGVHQGRHETPSAEGQIADRALDARVPRTQLADNFAQLYSGILERSARLTARKIVQRGPPSYMATAPSASDSSEVWNRAHRNAPSKRNDSLGRAWCVEATEIPTDLSAMTESNSRVDFVGCFIV